MSFSIGVARPRYRLSRAVMLGYIVALVATGCVAPADTSRGPTAQSVAPVGPKTLRLGWDREPLTLYTGSGGNTREYRDIFSAGLTYVDATGTVQPKLAVKVPTIADGDWKIASDGSMEVTWQLKPNLTWHDGAPLNASEFVFAHRLFKDPASIFVVPPGIRRIGEVSAPSLETIVFRYQTLYNNASEMGAVEFPPVPGHLLEEQYNQVGAQVVTNSPFWSLEWVGLGPYRLTNRVLATHMEAEAFDGYVWGRPKIDRLLIRLTMDNPNALVAYLLANEIDMAPIGSLDPAHYDVLKTQLNAAGKGTVNGVLARARQFQWQFRDPTAPWAADLRVRQAMLMSIDRQAIADGVYLGLTQVAHAVLLPTDRLYAPLEQRGIRKYPFDRREAEQLLDAAGWPRSADGVRRNAAGTVLSHVPSTVASKDQELLAMVVDFNAVGIRSTPDIFPTGMSDEAEHRAKADSNGRNAQWDSSGVYWDRFLSSQIAGPPRWNGANNGGYVNPIVDGLFERWLAAVVPDERRAIELDFHKLLLDELAYLPLVYDFEIFAFRQGLVGPKPFAFEGGNTTADIHTWTLD